MGIYFFRKLSPTVFPPCVTLSGLGLQVMLVPAHQPHWVNGGKRQGVPKKKKKRLLERTGKELQHLAARTAGAMEAMVMVVTDD